MTKYNMNINNQITQDTESVKPESKTEYRSTKKPNEQVGFHFSSSMKITDPNTGTVLLQIRCD